MAEVEHQPIKESPAADSMAAGPSAMTTEGTSAAPPTGTEAMATEIALDPSNNLQSSMPAATEPMQPKEEKFGKDTVKIEAQPASEGVLGYKAPGLIKSLRFSKKYFWFSDQPVESKSLSAYLRDEKSEIGHHNAAYATQTGKGLLFFAKRVEDKLQPAGILHLADASDVTKEGLTDFSVKLHGYKHTFQAANAAERDSWIVAVESKAADAKADLDVVKNSEGYKSSKKSFAGSASAIGGAAAAKPTTTPSNPATTADNTAENPAEAMTDKAVATPVAEKKPEKARSQSRKRQSIFGKFVAKKDEVEEKREVKKEEKAEKKAEKAEEKEERKEEKKEEEAAMMEGKMEEKAEAKEEKKEQMAEKKAEKETEKEGETTTPIATVNGETAKTGTAATSAPRSSKRGSVFGNFFNKKDTPKEKEKEVAPMVPAKDTETEPMASTAPQMEEPAGMMSEEPIMSVTAPGEAMTETPAAPVPAGETVAKTTATTPDTKEKRRQSFFSLGGKKEKRPEVTSDTEGAEKSGSATAKLGNVFRRASRSAKPTSSTVTDSGTPPPISKDVETPAEPAAMESMASESDPVSTEKTMNESIPATVSASA